MAEELKPIRIVISADSKAAQQALDKAERSLGKFSKGLKAFEQAARGGDAYMDQLAASIENYEMQAQAAAQKTGELSQAYEEMEKSGTASAEELSSLARKLSAAQSEAERYASKLADARAEHLALNGEVGASAEELSSLARKLSAAQSEAERYASKLADARAEHLALNGEVGALYKQLQDTAAATRNQSAQLDAMGDAAGAARARAEGLEAQQRTLVQITDALQKAMNQATIALGENSAEAERLKGAYSSANAELEKTNTAIKQASGSLGESTQQILTNTLTWGELGDTLSSRVTQPLLAIGKSALQSAADAQAMESSFNAAFGAQADGARRWSQQLAESLDAGETHIRAGMLSWQTLFNGMEISGRKSAEMVTDLTERAYNMSALFDTDVTVVLDKMRSAMVGNHESLRDLGVVITESTLKEAAYAKGIARRGKELTEQQKVLTRHQLIMEQTAQAQGRWNAESDDASGKLRILLEKQEEIQKKLGEALLPILNKVLDVVLPLVDAMSKMSGTGWGVVAVIGALVAALGPVLKIVTLVQNAKIGKGIKAVTSAAGGLNSFMGGPFFATLSKVLMIVLALSAAIALVAAFIALANGNMARYQESLNKSREATSQMLGDAKNAARRVGRNARGTSYWRGGLTWVGEEGPELIDLPQGAKIHPADKARRSAGGDTFIFNVDFDRVRDVQKLLDTAQNARRISRQGGGMA